MRVNPRSFTAIRETIAIRIGSADFCMKVVFTNIGQTVFVQISQRVITQRIKAILHLPAIRHPIFVRIDEQWVRLIFDGKSHDNHIDILGADWIGGYDETLKKVEPYLDYEVDDMVVEEFPDREYDGEKAQMICVTVYPPSNNGDWK